MDYAQWIPFISAALLLVVLALVVILLARQSRQQRRQQEANQAQEEFLRLLADDLLDALDQGHAESISALREAGQQQYSLLDSVQRQVLLSTRNQEERAGQTTSALSQNLTQLDARMEQLRQSTQQGLTNLRQENDRQLSEMRRTVDEKLTESLDKRLTASFAQVSQRLEQVYKGLGEMQTLAAGVGDLKKVLTNVKTRGVWGEMQLGALLEQLLAPGQYDTNVAVVPGAAERVEFAIRLPGKLGETVYLPIDSKFPQEDYIRLTEATQSGDTQQVDAARKALLTRIRQEAKRIAGKYVAPPHTTDFAIMFLPVEGLYAEAVQDPALMDAIQRELRIVVAGPATFAALLNALQMGFRTLAIEQRTSEVWALLGAVKTDFGKFADTLEKTRQRIHQASESIDSAFTRTRSIQRRLGAVEILSDAPAEEESTEEFP